MQGYGGPLEELILDLLTHSTPLPVTVVVSSDCQYSECVQICHYSANINSHNTSEYITLATRMATPKYSLMDRFDSDTESIESYLERVAIYFRANRVEERNQVDVFLSLLSSKMYSLLRDLEAPEKPGDKTFAELSDTLTKHFQPKRKVISERFKFHKRTQAVGESVIDFVAELRKLSKFCKFEAHLDQALRVQFVSGLRNGSIQKQRFATEP